MPFQVQRAERGDGKKRTFGFADHFLSASEQIAVDVSLMAVREPAESI